MGRVIVEQIVSLDGYAEYADGGIGFFGNAKQVNEADTEQLRMLSSASAIVLGAKTYHILGARQLSLVGAQSYPGGLVVLEYNSVR